MRSNQSFVPRIDLRKHDIKLIHRRYYIYFAVYGECPASNVSGTKSKEWEKWQNIALPLEFNEGQRYRSTSDVPMGKYRDSSTLRGVRQFPRSLGGYLFSLLLPVMHLIPYPFTVLRRLILIIFPSLSTRPRAFGSRFVQPTWLILKIAQYAKILVFFMQHYKHNSYQRFYRFQLDGKCTIPYRLYI